MALSGREKATIFLSILGPESSARILRYLPDELADVIAAGLQRVPAPSPEAIAAVLEDFNRLVLPSPEERRALKPTPKPSGTPLEILASAPPKQLAGILASERPQTVAFVLAHFDPQRHSEILSLLPEMRREVELLLKDIRVISLTEEIREGVLKALAKRLF